MEPTLKPGQEILVSSLPYLFQKPKTGDVVAFEDKDLFVVKRIKDIKDGKYLVKGDNQKDSREFGWIERKRILGKVIYIMGS